MRTSALFLLLAAACGPSAKQINADVHVLHSLAVQANARHQAECTPPPADAPPRDKPAVCDPLRECLHHADEASGQCSDVIQQLAQRGQGDAGACLSSRDVALRTCAAVHIQPQTESAEGHDGGR